MKFIEWFKEFLEIDSFNSERKVERYSWKLLLLTIVLTVTGWILFIANAIFFDSMTLLVGILGVFTVGIMSALVATGMFIADFIQSVRGKK